MVDDWQFGDTKCWASTQLHPTKPTAAMSVMGFFGPKDAKRMRKYGRWLMRAADYLESQQ